MAAPAPTVCSTVPSACMMSPPTWPKAGKSATLEAATPEAVAGRPVGRSLPWERRASQSGQPRPEEAREPASGTAQGGGHFDHDVAALAPADAEAAPVIVTALALVAVHARPALGLLGLRGPVGGECAVVQRLDA